MNLYKIKVAHYSLKDSHTSIEKYVLANNESEIYDILCKITYWNEKSYDSIYRKLNYYSNTNLIDRIPNWFKEAREDDDFNNAPKEDIEMLDQLWKEYVISTKGELNSDWANYDDLYYGRTHYGWELVEENLTDKEMDFLIRLNIVTNS